MISYDIAGRQAGKTTRALTFLRRNPGSILVVPDHSQAEYFVHQGIGRSRVRTVQSHLEGRTFGQWDKPVVIDNLDIVLHELFRSPYIYATSTGVLVP